MKECVLHIGMHKTGSSSIQKFLNEKRYEIKNASYAEGENHSSMILLAFMREVEKHHTFKVLSLTNEQLEDKKNYALHTLRKSVELANTKLIISGEGIIFLNKNELQTLKSYLENYFDKITILTYVRGFNSYINSAFSQMVKSHDINVEKLTISPNYRKKFEKFEDVFGSVKYRIYDRNILVNGNVLSDFISINGLGVKAHKTEENVGLSDFSVRFLYNFHKVRTDLTINVNFVHQFCNHLQKIESTKFSICNTWLSKYQKAFSDDIKWIESRLGKELPTSNNSVVSDKVEELADVMKFHSMDIEHLIKLQENTDFIYLFNSQCNISYSDYVDLVINTLNTKQDPVMNVKTNKLKIHAYIICYNEEYIIKNVLDYYTQLCSKVFLLDNESTDNTLEIAKNYNNVEIISFSSEGLDDSLHVKLKTELYKKHSRHCGVDWVICCDMDEILYHHDLIGVLKDYKNKGVMVPNITAFDMVDEKNVNTGLGLLEQYNMGVRTPAFDKRIIFDPKFDMAYSHGCHPYGPGFEYMKKSYGYSSSREHPIALLHFKHIGSRLLDTAYRNLARFDNDSIRKESTGYSGPGSQYKHFIDKAFKQSPLLKQAKQVICDGVVLFDDFEPATSDRGYVKVDKAHELTPKDIGTIRDSALVLENDNHKLALRLMKVAKKLRPNGSVITDFIKRLEKR